MEDDRIDFSALDPSGDALRWRRVLDGVVARALEERRRRLTVGAQLLRWARPVLAVAAALCILSWGAALIGSPEPNHRGVGPAAMTLAEWAANHRMPAPDDLLAILRGNP